MLLTQVLTTLIQSYCNLNVAYPPDNSAVIQNNDEFDFIVVGAGSAGSVVANRLTEVADWRVLLIEVGSNPPVESEIPALFTTLLNSKYDWSYKTEESDFACQGMANNQCVWAKGKMLGGSSSINAMYYVRGNKWDYDNWEKVGNPGWGYDDVLKYFKKLENVNDPRVTPGVHGNDGYMRLSYTSNSTYFHASAIERMIREAAMEEGLPLVEDCSSNTRSCVTESLFTIKEGTRMSTAKAYLASVRERENLVLMKESTVTKLLIDERKRVYGVEVHVNGKFIKVLSKKEVIVSAGSIASPQLLMLSGIGPKKDLEDLGIGVVNELKVGYNLQDHIFLNNYYAKLNLPDDAPEIDTDPMYSYLTRRNDIFSTPLSPSLLFTSTNGRSDRPNVQFHFWNASPKNPFLAAFFASLNFKPEFTSHLINANQHLHLVSLLVKLIRPLSRGRVTLSSSNPFVAPKIINGYLTEDEDVRVLIDGTKLATRMIKSKALNGSVYTVPVPKCDKFDSESDQFYECYIRHFVSTVYHAAGTCKMGPKSDPDAVVDATLKVHGVDGLRVADASIMPIIVSGNTNIPTIMIGEKVSDMIKEEWLKEIHSEL